MSVTRPTKGSKLTQCKTLRPCWLHYVKVHIFFHERTVRSGYTNKWYFSSLGSQRIKLKYVCPHRCSFIFALPLNIRLRYAKKKKSPMQELGVKLQLN